MGLDCVRRTYDLLHVSDWKIEKVTKKGDTISSIHREKMGKIYKLTVRVLWSRYNEQIQNFFLNVRYF